MKISANEIASIETMGTLDGHDIKIIRTKGGLHLAVGVDSKGRETVMGAASHPAILCYNIEKQHPNFHPAMMKSEKLVIENADKHSHFLPDDLRKSGYDIYSVQNDVQVNFYLTKYDFKIAAAHAEIAGDTLILKSVDKDFCLGNSAASAVSEKALSMGLKKVRMDK